MTLGFKTKISDCGLTSSQSQKLEKIPTYQLQKEQSSNEIILKEDIGEQERVLSQDRWGAFMHQWVQSMVELDNPLREQMALFWHHHIPSNTGHKFEHGQLLLEIYRKHGLGNLRDLLVEMAANPAIMYFLDGHWSHKDNPNENFPRELMELFALGEGNYAIEDVKEAARAFTGRRFDHENYPYAMFIAKDAQDQGEKTIFGKRGNWSGEDVIDLILQKKQTARHIATAVLRFFVADEPPAEWIESCAEIYFQSNYQMMALLKHLAERIETKDSRLELKKVKTPVELLVNFQRQTGLRAIGIKTTLHFLRACGQQLFAPPGVGGWPKGDGLLKGQWPLHRLFLTSALLEVANRTLDKNGIAYKMSSRFNSPELRSYRYIADAVWDQEVFYKTLKDNGLSVSEWMIGRKYRTDDLFEVLQSEEYQFD